jgi:ribose 5-phosphate isomerase
MDGRTKPSELYIVDHNNNILDEDNEKIYNETINDIEGWVEDGITTDVIKIATSIDDTATTRTDVDG